MNGHFPITIKLGSGALLTPPNRILGPGNNIFAQRSGVDMTPLPNYQM